MEIYLNTGSSARREGLKKLGAGLPPLAGLSYSLGGIGGFWPAPELSAARFLIWLRIGIASSIAYLAGLNQAAGYLAG